MSAEQHQPDRVEISARVELTQLWLKHQSALQVFVSSAIPDRHGREDVIQSTAEQVARNFEHYDHSRPFEAWLIGIAKYSILAYYRARQRDRLVFSERELDLLSGATKVVCTEIGSRVEALERCMSKLSSRHKSMLYQRYVHGRKSGDIAERMGTTSSTISSTLRRVRLALAECIRRQLRMDAPQ